MRLLRFEDLTVVPWKNGGGVTREIAVHAEPAVHPEFLWRISVATVDKAGPFSRFDGVDRSIAVLQGRGMRLDGGAAGVTLTPQSPPYAFPGEAPIEAELLDGPTTDLNVMTRRGLFSHRMERLTIDGPVAVEGAGEETAFVFNGAFAVETPEARFSARPLDVLLGLRHDEKIRLSPEAQADIFVIRVFRAD